MVSKVSLGSSALVLGSQHLGIVNNALTDDLIKTVKYLFMI